MAHERRHNAVLQRKEKQGQGRVLMAELYKNWRIILVALFVILAIGIIAFRGVQFGIDFKGGTLFQVQLSEPIKDLDERARIVQTIQQRLDWTGLRDMSVNFFGDEFVIVQKIGRASCRERV